MTEAMTVAAFLKEGARRAESDADKLSASNPKAFAAFSHRAAVLDAVADNIYTKFLGRAGAAEIQSAFDDGSLPHQQH